MCCSSHDPYKIPTLVPALALLPRPHRQEEKRIGISSGLNRFFDKRIVEIDEDGFE
jgi:hypothetical protein